MTTSELVLDYLSKVAGLELVGFQMTEAMFDERLFRRPSQYFEVFVAPAEGIYSITVLNEILTRLAWDMVFGYTRIIHKFVILPRNGTDHVECGSFTIDDHKDEINGGHVIRSSDTPLTVVRTDTIHQPGRINLYPDVFQAQSAVRSASPRHYFSLDPNNVSAYRDMVRALRSLPKPSDS